MNKQERYDSLWLEKYSLAKQYYEEHGNLLIPQSYTVNGIKLGTWINTQRKFYTRKTLSEERIKLLEHIGMTWNFGRPDRNNFLKENNLIANSQDEYNDVKWNYLYNLASLYYQEYGNLLIPTNYIVKNIKLGVWIQNQRTSYKKGTMSEERVKKLESIGMNWQIRLKVIKTKPKTHNVENSREAIWFEYYELAKQYYQKHGNLLVPMRYTAKNLTLGHWIRNQRAYYTNGKLPEDKIKLLERIGMNWHPRLKVTNIKPKQKIDYNAIWLKNYELAKFYYEEHGDLLIPRKYSVNGLNLGVWLNTQRTAYSNKKLSEDRINLLENIGMVWYSRVVSIKPQRIENQLKNWNNKYQLAVSYYKTNGHLSIPQTYTINDIHLGTWINTQRVTYKEGKLSKEQISLLESIGMIWNVNKNNEYIRHLCITYNLDYLNPVINKIPYRILKSIINYLIFNNLPLIENNELNKMFLMTNYELKAEYNLTYEELVNNYYEIKVENSCKKHTLEK